MYQAIEIEVPEQNEAAVKNSEPFRPKAPFIIQAVGSLAAEFTIQQSPEQVDAWETATGSNMVLMGTTKIANGNYAYGFRYRIQKNDTAQAAEIKFYMGSVTTRSYNLGS